MWVRHGAGGLRLMVGLMATLASVWMGYQFWRLLWQQGYWGAIDLKTFHRLVQSWFAGASIYTHVKTAVHPPATYLILWPLVGWLDLTATRWLWAATTVIALVWLIRVIVAESNADTPLERAFVTMLPLSMYATGATIGNGQLIIHILPVLLFGLLRLFQAPPNWSNDALIALTFLFALVKPSVAAPFFWIILFCPGRSRPGALILAGYVALTLFAALFQTESLPTLLSTWLANPAVGQPGQANIRAWLVSLGLREWALTASIILLLAHATWLYRYRSTDLWILLGVTALAARISVYHRWYDDLLILLPMIALFRIAKSGAPDGNDIAAGVLLALCVFATLAPGGLYLFPEPWNTLYTTFQTLIWFLVLIFLIARARHNRKEISRESVTQR